MATARILRREPSQAALGAQGRTRRLAHVIIFACVVSSVIALKFDRARFIHAYFVAFGALWTLSLGGLFLTLLHHVLGARWSVATTRRTRPLVALLPWCALLFAPVVFWVKDLFPWMLRTSEQTAHPLHFATYFHLPSFIVRAAVYWLIWLALASVYCGKNLQSGGTRELQFARRLSGPALVLFAFTTTFAGFDWFMSIQSNWHSAVFGVYLFAGAVPSALAFLAILTVVLERFRLVSTPMNTNVRHDIGKLLFGFVVFWAYIAFSQYLLIWYAGLTSETPFFRTRFNHDWLPTTLLLFGLHFVLPFIGLLSAAAKRSPAVLGAVSLIVLAAHVVDLFWLVMPALESRRSHFCFADIPAVLMLACTLVILLAKGIEGELRWPESKMATAPMEPVHPDFRSIA